MKKTKRHSNLQSRLFLLIGTVTAISALMIGVTVVSLLGMEKEAQVMHRRSQELNAAYEAITYVQQMDLTQSTMFTRFDESGLNKHDGYSHYIDDYLQQAILAAETNEQIKTLDTFSQEKSNYDQIFSSALVELDKAPEDINISQYEELRQGIKQSILAMYSQLYEIIRIDTAQMAISRNWVVNRSAFLMQMGLVGLILFGLIALAVLFMISRTVYQPILHIREAIRTMSQGTFDPTSVEKLAKRPDEMGKLAEVFLEMAQAVSDRKESLENQADGLRAQIKKLSQ